MIDLTPHAKAIVEMDKMLDAWIASGGIDKGAKAALEEFMVTDAYYAIPYQHRNLYFVTASKLRSYEFLPEEAYKRYIQCVDLPWADHDFFRVGRAFDYRITEGEEKYAKLYVAVDRRENGLEEKLAAYQADMEELNAKEAKTKTDMNKMVKLAQQMQDLENLKGKSQLTQSQWKSVENMTTEYRLHKTFPQTPKKLTLFWLAFGKIPCKAELDHYDADQNRIWDIKTTGSLTQFDPQSYLLQMAFYFAGIQEELMLRPEAALAVVDKGGDFSRGCPFGFKVEDLLAAQDRVNRLTNQWKESMETNTWPNRGANDRQALRVYWDSDYYPLLEHSRPTEIIYV